MQSLALLATVQAPPAAPDARRQNSGADVAIWIAVIIAISSNRQGHCRLRATKKREPSPTQPS